MKIWIPKYLSPIANYACGLAVSPAELNHLIRLAPTSPTKVRPPLHQLQSSRMFRTAPIAQLAVCVPHRLFSTTFAVSKSWAHITRRRTKAAYVPTIGDPDTLLPSEKPAYPPYPYGDAQIYKQSNRGLYGGKILQFGHQVSEKFNQKSVRVFHPNIQKTTLYSEALKRKLSIKLATSVLRTITKEGGLDNYLLKDTSARIKELGPFGWKLRFDVLKRLQKIEQTSPKIIPGYTVGKSRLIKDLFALGGQLGESLSFLQFRRKYQSASAEELISSLESAGVDVSKYKAAA